MNTKRFIDGLGANYKVPYEDYPKIDITRALSAYTGDQLQKLYDHVLINYEPDKYEKKGPPQVRVLLNYAKKLFGKVERQYEYLSRCEFCKAQYPLDKAKCPKCGKWPGVGFALIKSEVI